MSSDQIDFLAAAKEAVDARPEDLDVDGTPQLRKVTNLAEARDAYDKVIEQSRSGKVMEVKADDYALALAFMVETRQAEWVPLQARTKTGAAKKGAAKKRTTKAKKPNVKQAQVSAALDALKGIEF